MIRPMHSYFTASSLVLFSLFLGCTLSRHLKAETPDGKTADLSLKVMTYNLRYASDTPPNAWPDRRPLVAKVIRESQPDLFGTQEGVYTQLKELAADLPHYNWIGLGRDGGSHGEFMAIFYMKDRFEPLEYDHFWLSDTPDVVASTSWGNQNRRMVTWVRFFDRKSQREFYLMNTHLDHAVQVAREKGAALIRERVKLLREDLPLVMTGDFNAVAGDNKAYDILTAEPFQDTWNLAAQRQGEDLNTFNSFRSVMHEGKRIDWILVRGQAKVSDITILDHAENGQFPSDHFPVVARIRFAGE